MQKKTTHDKEVLVQQEFVERHYDLDEQDFNLDKEFDVKKDCDDYRDDEFLKIVTTGPAVVYGNGYPINIDQMESLLRQSKEKGATHFYIYETNHGYNVEAVRLQYMTEENKNKLIDKRDQAEKQKEEEILERTKQDLRSLYPEDHAERFPEIFK